MNENKIQKNVIDMAVVNTDSLTFVKNGMTPDGAFTVTVLLKKIQDAEQFAIMFFMPKPQPKVMLFVNTNYGADEYKGEIELYKQYISQSTGVDYSTNGLGFDAKMEVKLDVQGYTSKQEVDENGQPVFNEDGTPKMVNKPLTVTETKFN